MSWVDQALGLDRQANTARIVEIMKMFHRLEAKVAILNARMDAYFPDDYKPGATYEVVVRQPEETAAAEQVEKKPAPALDQIKAESSAAAAAPLAATIAETVAALDEIKAESSAAAAAVAAMIGETAGSLDLINAESSIVSPASEAAGIEETASALDQIKVESSADADPASHQMPGENAPSIDRIKAESTNGTDTAPMPTGQAPAAEREQLVDDKHNKNEANAARPTDKTEWPDAVTMAVSPDVIARLQELSERARRLAELSEGAPPHDPLRQVCLAAPRGFEHQRI